jgi:hypothetical protein
MEKNWERSTQVFDHRVYYGRNLSKRHGTKCGAIGNSLGNPMETSSTHWELHWEPGENKMWAPKSRKSNPTPPACPLSPHPQRKRIGPSQVHVEPSHWLPKLFNPKTLCCHFLPWLVLSNPFVTKDFYIQSFFLIVVMWPNGVLGNKKYK